MKVCITLLICSAVLNIGLVSGYIRVASPDSHAQVAYMDNQRELMTELMEVTGDK